MSRCYAEVRGGSADGTAPANPEEKSGQAGGGERGGRG